VKQILKRKWLQIYCELDWDHPKSIMALFFDRHEWHECRLYKWDKDRLYIVDIDTYRH